MTTVPSSRTIPGRPTFDVRWLHRPIALFWPLQAEQAVHQSHLYLVAFARNEHTSSCVLLPAR